MCSDRARHGSPGIYPNSPYEDSTLWPLKAQGSPESCRRAPPIVTAKPLDSFRPGPQGSPGIKPER
jgi:hypothetical protein